MEELLGVFLDRLFASYEVKISCKLLLFVFE